MPAAITLSFPEPDIALLTFDMPDKGANVLSQAVLGSWPGISTRWRSAATWPG